MGARRVVGAIALGLVTLALLVLSALAVEQTPADLSAELPAAGTPGAGTSVPAPTPPAGPPVLLPNLRSLDADDMQLEVVAGVRRLRFAASLANLGPGPLILVPRGRQACPPRQHAATQHLVLDADRDGVYERRRDTRLEREFAGCMLRHRGHDHWHFDAMARYALREPGADHPLVSRDKVSFCLRDNRKVPGEPVVVPREHFGECTARGPQGISPGWVDVYPADLAGQWLPIPDGLSGLLCLDVTADPANLVEETDETDNGIAIAVRITGDAVRRAGSGACVG